MKNEKDQSTERQPATRFPYGGRRWWRGAIQSYAAMRLSLKGAGLEQNHLVHEAILKKGPPATQHLVRYIPAITLSMEEHRGKKYSYHTMKDRQQVGGGPNSFRGCGMDAYLRSRRIDVNRPSFTLSEVSKAIDASADYWEMIGVDHAAAAVRQFKTEIFENPIYRRNRAED
ncbi:MAG TPA: hypothetical protein VFA33_19860 [Bryobacteraceae bacterium]|nr:hypothetical protein [Bryobacteraceae bacterium]